MGFYSQSSYCAPFNYIEGYGNQSLVDDNVKVKNSVWWLATK